MYIQSGSYQFVTIDAFGCDSTATLNLTIEPSISASEVQALQKGYIL